MVLELPVKLLCIILRKNKQLICVTAAYLDAITKEIYEPELRLSLSVALVSRFKGLSRATAVRLRGCGLCK